MKWIIVILVLLLAVLQYRLWISEGSLAHRAALEQQIDKQKAENQRLKERNAVLAIEVEALKSGLDAIEERAREQMGMVKQDETFFMIIDREKSTDSKKTYHGQ
jgi:cell division protein FtsB